MVFLWFSYGYQMISQMGHPTHPARSPGALIAGEKKLLPSGKRWHKDGKSMKNHGQSPCLLGKLFFFSGHVQYIAMWNYQRVNVWWFCTVDVCPSILEFENWILRCDACRKPCIAFLSLSWQDCAVTSLAYWMNDCASKNQHVLW